MAKILIVDDRALNRKFLLTLLGYRGYQLSEAADGAEALVKIRAEHPDLIVTDLLMPTMDGFQLVQQMRREPAIAATDVIFYTATYRLNEADELAKACGVSVVIPKPSDPQLIIDTVNAVLGKTPPPTHGPAALIPAENEIPEIHLKSTLTDYVLNLKLLSAQMSDLVHEGDDLAHEEAAVLEVSQKLRHATVELQAVSLKLASLLELGLELTAHRNPDELLNVFCRAAVSVIGAKYGALGILTDEGQGLAYFKRHGKEEVDLAAIEPTSPRAGILGDLLDEPRPRREHNPEGNPRAFGLSPTHPPIHNFLGVPVISSEQAYGWFYLADKLNGEKFGQEDEQLASTLAAQLAVVYQAARMYDEVQRHAAKLEIEASRRKQAEETFHSAIQAAPNGMLMANSAGKIILVNSRMVELFGYQSEELIGQPVEILVPERARAAHVQHRGSFMLNPQTRNMGAGRDLYGRRKDGSEFPVEIGLNPLATNEGLCVLASIIDITERKKSDLAMRERMRLAEFTAEISGALATQADLRAMLQKCAEAVVQHLEAAFARIWTLNARENILELQASAGMYTHIDGGHGRVPVGQFKIGLIAQERRPHLTNAVVGDPRVNDQEWAMREGMVGFAGYPLLVDGRLVGVIAMFTRKPIPATIFETMASCANEIAVGIERKLSEERERQHNERIRALHEIDRAITSTLDLNTILSVVMKSVEQFFSSTAAVGVALVNHETRLLEPIAARGMPLDEWKRAFFDANNSFVNVAALTGPLFIPDLRASPQHQPEQRDFIDKYGHASLLVVPIQIEDRPLGLLGLATKAKYEFSNSEIEFFVTLAGQAAVAIQNAELYGRTKRQSADLAEQERVQRILKEVSQDITTLSVHDLMEKLTATIRAVFKVDVSDVRFLGQGRWQNVLVSSDQGTEWLPGGGEFGQGANLWIVNNRRSLAIRDYSESKEFTPGRVVKMFDIRGFLAAPLISKSGEVIGVIRALSKSPRDFTAREIDLFEQLTNGAAVAIENERLYTSLQKSDKVKSEFLGIMSHELRTPLNIIMGYAALARQDLIAKGNDSGDNPITKIETQSRILLDMINSIMEATQLEAGAIGVTEQRVDVRALFERLQAAYDSSHAKELALIWRLPDDLPLLVTDDAKLQHILKNLIDNAIKFTESGTVTVSARVIEGQGQNVSSVTYQVPSPDVIHDTWHLTRDLPDTSSEIRDTPSEQRDTRFVEFSVADTGVGIAEETLPFIFEMFRQADSSINRPYDGAGLGLYIVKQYCNLLGASVRVESALEKGSTFTVAIPLNEGV